jgi:uncharacterized protein YegJ (DUF2314 family)
MQVEWQRRVVPGGLGFLGAALMAVSPVAAQVIDFRSSDREMNHAIAEARRTLPDFVALYRAGRGERHAVKVAIPYDRGREHVWMNLTAIEGDVFIGKIANDPVHLGTMNRGDSYRAGSAMVSDWNYRSGGQMHGSYTTRVAIKKLTPTQVRELGLNLAPLP